MAPTASARTCCTACRSSYRTISICRPSSWHMTPGSGSPATSPPMLVPLMLARSRCGLSPTSGGAPPETDAGGGEAVPGAHSPPAPALLPAIGGVLGTPGAPPPWPVCECRCMLALR